MSRIDIRYGQGVIMHPAVAAGFATLAIECAFEIGRQHRTLDSYGPVSRHPVFETPELQKAFELGYKTPYWWERTGGPWHSFYPESPEISYYMFLRAVYGKTALEARTRMLQVFGGWRK